MDFTLFAYKQLISTLQSQGYFFQTLQDFIQQPEDRTVILRHDVDRKPGNAFVIAKIEKESGIKASYYFRIVKESYDEDVIRQIAEMGHEIGYHYENLSEISKGEIVKRKQNRENRNEEKGKGKGQRGNRIEKTGMRKKERGDREEEIGISKQETVEKEREGREWDFLWKARMNRMIRMVGWKQLNVEKEEIKEGLKNELFELAIDDFRLNLEKLRELYPVKTICMHGSPLSKWDNRDLWS